MPRSDLDYDREYGSTPKLMGTYSGPQHQWTELMHYLYLPVRLAYATKVVLPERLEFARDIVMHSIKDGAEESDYVYLTARRGYTDSRVPLNREGWHADGFGTDDLNYAWSDKWPTEIAQQQFKGISSDHIESMRQFDEQVKDENVYATREGLLYRLTPYVVHRVAPVPEGEGGMRSFLKVSISKHRYNLEGNSHNYLLDYKWKMYSREEIRNSPERYGQDFIP